MFQSAATIKYVFSDGGHRIGECDPGQSVAIIKRIVSNGGQPLGKGNGRQTIAIVKRVTANALQALGKSDSRQIAAIVERIVADGGHTLGHNQLRQSITVVKRPLADGSDAVRQRDAAQVGAAGKRVFADGRHAAFHPQGGKGVVAVFERRFAVRHGALAADGQYAVRVQLPDHLAAVQPVFRIHLAAIAAGHDLTAAQGDKQALVFLGPGLGVAARISLDDRIIIIIIITVERAGIDFCHTVRQGDNR